MSKPARHAAMRAFPATNLIRPGIDRWRIAADKESPDNAMGGLLATSWPVFPEHARRQ
jgi:hypothetical protein